MAKAIGIDLGTTNTAAGLKRLQTEIIPNAEGDPLTPSVVSYQKKRGLLKPGRFIVGKSALDWMSQDPQNTIVSVKRLMGRNFYDPEVQKLIEEQRYAYTVSPRASGSSHSVAVLLNGTEYTPEQISAKILEKVKSDCENRLGAPVQSAVVTVPAYFNDKQKHATRMAAALAGLKVQRLLPEPTAAAISFGVDTLSEGEAKTILVFDLGGGTFDISILTITDGQFIELGKGGDMWMGGDDIDAMISRYVYQQTEKDNEVEDLSVLIDQLTPTDKNRFVGDLKRNVEAAKIQLSKSDQALVEVLGLLKDPDGDIVDVEVELTREHFEDLLRPFVERAMTLTRKVVEGINFDLDLIDKVVMVGGSSSIPLVIQAMRELFGEDKVLLHERPMLAIAEGAAILAHRLADAYECPACGHEVTQSAATCPACGFDLVADLAKAGVVAIVHTTSHDYYLELEDGNGHLLVEKNTPLPFKTQGTFKLIDPAQRLAHFRFFNTVNEIKEPIGDLWLAFDRPEDEATKEAPRVLLDFELDEDNIISVSAALKDRPEVRVSRTLSRGNTDERLFLELEQSIAQVNEAKHSYFVAYDFLHRAVGIARAIHRVIDPRTGEENPEARREAVRRQQVANELVEKNESAIGNLYYAEHFVAQYGLFLKEAQRKSIEEKLQRLKDKSEQGSVAEILEARRKLSKELDKYPALMAIQDLEQAAEITAESDPAKAPRYDKYLQEVRNSIRKGDADTFARLMGEIMPEVHAILDAESGKDLHIWKGIQR